MKNKSGLKLKQKLVTCVKYHGFYSKYFSIFFLFGWFICVEVGVLKANVFLYFGPNHDLGKAKDVFSKVSPNSNGCDNFGGKTVTTLMSDTN